MLRSICGENASRRIQLTGLDLSAAIELAGKLDPAVSSSELVERLWQKCPGNPLFLTQLLHVAGAEELEGPVSQLTSTLLAPEAVRGAIGVHLQRLSVECQQALSVGTIFGLEFKLGTLAQVMGAPLAPLMELLDEACKAHVSRVCRSRWTNSFFSMRWYATSSIASGACRRKPAGTGQLDKLWPSSTTLERAMIRWQR